MPRWLVTCHSRPSHAPSESSKTSLEVRCSIGTAAVSSSPSSAGAYFPELERIYSEVDETLKDAANLNTSRGRQLRLGLMCTLGPKRLLELIEATTRSNAKIELSICEGKARRILDDLIADKFDVAIVALPVLPEEVASVPLHAERYVVAFRAGHRFESMDEIPLDELVAESYLERINCEFDEYYAAHFGDRPFDLNIRYSSEREDWIQAMILAGFGIAIMPELLPVMPGNPDAADHPARARASGEHHHRSRPPPCSSSGILYPHGNDVNEGQEIVERTQVQAR